jgi:hypothetical protein
MLVLLLFCLHMIVQDQVGVIVVHTLSCGTCSVLLELSQLLGDMQHATWERQPEL